MSTVLKLTQNFVEQFVKASHIQHSIRHFSQQVSDFILKVKQESRLDNAAKSSPVGKIEVPGESFVLASELPATPDSPGPRTPPSVPRELDRCRIVDENLWTPLVQELKGHIAFLHHAPDSEIAMAPASA